LGKIGSFSHAYMQTERFYRSLIEESQARDSGEKNLSLEMGGKTQAKKLRSKACSNHTRRMTKWRWRRWALAIKIDKFFQGIIKVTGDIDLKLIWETGDGRTSFEVRTIGRFVIGSSSYVLCRELPDS